MNIANFDDLLAAAAIQPEPQRLLFVFVGAELPENPGEEQKRRFEEKRGGYLLPLMFVDKLPAEVANFAALVEESRATGKAWDMVFVAGMSGSAGQPPSTEAAEPMLKKMVESIKGGRISHLLAFDRKGMPVQFF